MSSRLAEALRKTCALPLHPFLLAAYPVLALYAHNVAEIHPLRSVVPRN